VTFDVGMRIKRTAAHANRRFILTRGVLPSHDTDHLHTSSDINTRLHSGRLRPGLRYEYPRPDNVRDCYRFWGFREAKWSLHLPELDLAINTGLRKGSQYSQHGTW